MIASGASASFASLAGLVWLVLAGHDLAISDAEAELIALVASGAGAALATIACLIRSVIAIASNTEAELVAVVSSGTGAALSALASSV